MNYPEFNMIEKEEDQRVIEIGVALQTFVGEKEQDLSFKIGEKILIETKIKGSNWFYGSIGKRKGWFPSQCVKIEQHFIWNILDN